jgi:hypothetical protein
VFAAESMAAFPAPRLRQLSVALLALLAAAPGVAGFVVPALSGARLPLLAASAVAALMAWQAWERRRDDRFLGWTAAVLLFLATVGTGGYALGSREERAYETMTAAINRLDPQRDRDILVYRGHLPSVSFYRGKLAAMAFGMPREVQFETDEAWKDTYIDSQESLARYLSARKELFVVTAPENLDSLLAERPMACSKVFAAKRYSAYLCSRE